jgi:hypothetical protein
MITMADYTSIGTYQLNRWLVSKLKDLTWINDVTGNQEKVFKAYTIAGGSSPVPPLVQGAPLPEHFNISGGPPIIVFSYSTGAGVSWERKREQAAYVIWDANTLRLRVIQNYMNDLLSRYEWTAEEVNDYLNSTSVSPFDFKYVQVTTATSPDPAISEQGRQKGLIVAAFEYTRAMDQRGMRS